MISSAMAWEKRMGEAMAAIPRFYLSSRVHRIVFVLSSLRDRGNYFAKSVDNQPAYWQNRNRSKVDLEKRDETGRI